MRDIFYRPGCGAAPFRIMGPQNYSGPLRGYKYDYSLGSSSLTGVALRAREVSVSALIPDGGDEAAQLAMLADVEMGTPGTIVTDSGWAQRALVPAVELGGTENGWASVTLTIALLDGRWHREVTRELLPASRMAVEWLNLPTNPPYNLGGTRPAVELDTGWATPCPLRLTVWGPASSPSLRIGENTYSFGIDVPDGARLVADGTGARKSITLIDVNGDATDRFDCGARGSGLGSGTYCFEPLPAGPLGVSWDGSFGVTLAWWQTRGGLPWS